MTASAEATTRGGHGGARTTADDTHQARLALYGKALFIIAVGFYVVGTALAVILFDVQLDARMSQPDSVAHLSACAIMLILWIVCVRVPMTPRTLGIVETVSLVGICGAWGLLLQPGSDADDVLLAVLTTVVLRAIVVPSGARRTLGLTALASVPAFVIQLVVPPQQIPGAPAELMMIARSIDMGLWLIAGIAISTFASRVIYGLREQVAAARDIGQYTLERKLGAGGMGEVWLARHRLLIREAAVKIIRPAAIGSHPGAPEILLRRFEREARATAALRSPHTVQLYDFGIAADGTLYYVMELLEGMDLETMITRYGPVPAERVRHLIKQACHSLAEAHGRGLIHRDIKPANLYVTRAGFEGDFVKVLDFGLVKLGTDRDTTMRLTGAGTTTGTPAYMAPEIVEDHDVDHRADLYSLGCVAYFLLTGKLVFESDSSTRVMLDHVQAVPARPSTRTELPIPTAFEDVIMSCLEKKPSRRPQTAIELAERLDACAMPTAWTAERAEKWWDTHMPEREHERPLADVLLSHEARPQVLQVRDRRSG